MRVFVTGASGFIGSHVTRALLATGHEVAALARNNDSLWRLNDVAGKFTLLRGDLADLAALRPALAQWRPQASVHLAWYAEPGKYLHSPENIPSLVASLALLEALAQVGCRQVVAAGTCAEYEASRSSLPEDHPTRPATLYAAAKLSLCLMGQFLAAAAGTHFAWGRVFHLYGPYEDERRLAPAAIRTLLRGEPFPATAGEQVRDYAHVEDVAAAFGVLVEKQASGVFNVASGVPVTTRQLLETVGELVGRRELIQFGALPYRDWEPMFICGDNRRLRALGWAPRHELREGLSETIAWWRDRR